MSVGFAQIPATLRVPLFHVEFDSSRATGGLAVKRGLVIGQPTTAATGLALVTSVDAAAALYGAGSMLTRMIRAFRANNTFSELWALPVADSGSGVDATGTLAFTGPASAAGAVSLYIAGKLVPVAVASGDTATNIGDAVEAAVNADTTLPVTADATTGTVTLTARNAGTLGNSIALGVNLNAALDGEALPAGVGLTITAMASGATDPDLAGVAAALGDEEFEVIVAPYIAATPLNAMRDLMNDTTGRWAWSRQIYGHAFSASRDSVADLLTFGATRNDQHMTVVGYEETNPTYPADMAAAFAAQVLTSVSADPARPVQTLPLTGVFAAPTGTRFTKSQRQSLLSTGIATIAYEASSVQINRAVTTYRVNAFGVADASYLDCETLFTLAEVVCRLRAVITTKFPRSKLANDGTRFGAGQPIVTPKSIKAELVAQYAEMEAEGLVEDAPGFAAATIVVRNANDPSRVDVLYAPNLVNGLRIFAVLAQFRS
jgi:phage tail sheath gpL-like